MNSIGTAGMITYQARVTQACLNAGLLYFAVKNNMAIERNLHLLIALPAVSNDPPKVDEILYRDKA